ncbi:putative SGNH hydrolase-type esterase domain-containing protein [Rosa chinensis]|uniref:Putative SGNH hydrolase-type esterase domain-containing protein n=1 Tax=Rosa chinensis TaxID=74649 RepID=A0A2P6RZ17_ROSCH|nr:putative SGNH hydrolase-type esterase domain-containing protein [Rosa chinensis]
MWQVLAAFSIHGLFNYRPADNHELKQKAAALFVFGDSLFDIGNNQYLNTSARELSATYWPYGENFFHHPTGRFSDGRLVPDFIRQFAKLPIIPPYLQPGPHNFTDGTNFASADAGILPETNPGTVSLPLQLSYFKAVKKLLQQQLCDEEAKSLLGSAVYLISIGGNDYFSFYANYPYANESIQQEFVAIVISKLTIVLQEIYDLGGRKVAFQNAGPIGCLPSVKQAYNTELSDGCVEELESLIRLHNTALANVLKELESQKPGFKYSVFEYYDAIGDRMHNPAKYGFTDGSDACCGIGAYWGSGCGNETKGYELCSDPGNYVWFDGSHTTEKVNLQLAKLIWSGTPDVTGPYNVKQLFGHV